MNIIPDDLNEITTSARMMDRGDIIRIIIGESSHEERDFIEIVILEHDDFCAYRRFNVDDPTFDVDWFVGSLADALHFAVEHHLALIDGGVA